MASIAKEVQVVVEKHLVDEAADCLTKLKFLIDSAAPIIEEYESHLEYADGDDDDEHIACNVAINIDYLEQLKQVVNKLK